MERSGLSYKHKKTADSKSAEAYNYILRYAQDDSLLGNTELIIPTAKAVKLKVTIHHY